MSRSKVIVRPCAALVLSAALLAGCRDFGGTGVIGPLPAGTNVALASVVYGEGRFVAVGGTQGVAGDALVPGTERMLAAVSDDGGETWRRVPVPLPGALLQAAHGNGVFVAVGLDAFDGGEATVVRSDDGVTWQAVAGAPALRSVAFGNGLFVGVGFDVATRRALVLTSDDGAAWRAAAGIPGLAVPAVAFGGGAFVVWTEGGQVGASADGMRWSWTAVPWVNSLYEVAHVGGRWVASGTYDCCFGEVPEGVAYFAAASPDARQWETRAAPLRRSLFDIEHQDGVYVATSHDGLYSSADGAAWTPRRDAARAKDWRYDVAYGAGRWVAVGRTTIDVSTDGRTWRTLRIPD